MKKELKFIQCSHGDTIRYWWEIFVQLANFREMGYSDKSIQLIFIPYNTTLYGGFKELEIIFPETQFLYFEDKTAQVLKLIQAANYPPIIRLWCLYQFFQSLESSSSIAISNTAWFYHDSDIIFLDKIDFTVWLNDEINYLSDTRTYMDTDYFESKTKDVAPSELENYKKRDILDECAEFAGITREICTKNKFCTGGAQYLLKNMNSKFFMDAIESCLPIRNHLRFTNQQFFSGNTPEEKENSGFQSWCADMWAILWNLWRKNQTVITPKELDFRWATNEIEGIDNIHKNIYHNAGVTSEEKLTRRFGKETIECPAFYKNKYINKSPFGDTTYLQSILNHPVSSLYSTSLYVKEILRVQQKYSLYYEE